jgi:hypothetical protein
MGVYVVAIGEHHLEHQMVDEAAQLLAPTFDVMQRHAPVWRAWWRTGPSWPISIRQDPAPHWNISARIEEKQFRVVELKGPYGIGIDISQRFYAIRLTQKWGAFLDDVDIRQAVTSLCVKIAECVGGKELIYVPDSAYQSSCAIALTYQNLPIEAIVAWLEFECGSPAGNILDHQSTHNGEGTNKDRRAADGQQQNRVARENSYFIADLH